MKLFSPRPVPFSAPRLGYRECRAVTRVLRSGWLTTGPENRALEEEFSSRLNNHYALSVNSATAALHLLLEALDIGPGEYVVTTPYTFTASSEIIRYLGAHPLFVDIDERTGNMDPRELSKVLRENRSKKLSALLIVHIGGYPCDMDEILPLAEEYGLPLIEDCAHAFPVNYIYRGNTYPVGTLGQGAAFSFYANKTMTTGEGGMAVTSREDLRERMTLMRLHGIDRDVWNRYSGRANHLSWQYDIKAPGFKYNLTNFQAAMGRVQLKKSESMKKERREQAERYAREFAHMEELSLPPMDGDNAWHLFMIRLEREKLSIGRDDFLKELHKKGINCSVHYRPLHMMSYYRETYAFVDDSFPRGANLYRRVFSLPLYPGLTRRDQSRVIRAVKETVKQYGVSRG